MAAWGWVLGRIKVWAWHGSTPFGGPGRRGVGGLPSAAQRAVERDPGGHLLPLGVGLLDARLQQAAAGVFQLQPAGQAGTLALVCGGEGLAEAGHGGLRVGAAPGTAKLKRFLVGPLQAEITGITESPDGKALFVNIQHPGEDMPVADIGDPTRYTSHWPDGGLARPRSATIVIQRDDGGVVGV